MSRHPNTANESPPVRRSTISAIPQPYRDAALTWILSMAELAALIPLLFKIQISYVLQFVPNSACLDFLDSRQFPKKKKFLIVGIKRIPSLSHLLVFFGISDRILFHALKFLAISILLFFSPNFKLLYGRTLQ